MRRLDPLGLVLKAGAWYLVARSGPRIRIYRVDKMRAATLLDDGFARPRHFDLAGHWQAEVARFESGLRRAWATVRVASDAMVRIEELGTDVAERVRSASPDAAGRRTAQIAIESVDHAASRLLGFAAAVEVLKPVRLRRRIAALAAGVTTLYAARR